MTKPGPRKIRTVKVLVLLGVLLAGGVFAFACLRKDKGLPFVSRPQIFSIGLYSGPSPFELSPHAGAANPIVTAETITDVPADFVADPFVVEHDGTWFLFFEVLVRGTYDGDIGLATSKDGMKWEYAGIVLDEPYHLSYPQVFEWQDRFYMIPESNRAGAIRLYEAKAFPAKWSFRCPLVIGRYVDPTVFRHQDRWWMFASDISSATLHLFHAEKLEGPWIEHVKSPVVEANGHTARCAGRVLEHEGRLLRFAQDCDPVYGQGVRVLEITELSTESYQEREIDDNLLCKGDCDWNAGGMHHVSFMKGGVSCWAGVEG